MEHQIVQALPTALMVMTTDLVIVFANPAYERAVGIEAGDLIGRYVFEVFPPEPESLDAEGVSFVQRSFERSIASGLIDVMPVANYPLRNPQTGVMDDRFWSLASVPILSAAGEVELLMQRVEDITAYVRETESRRLRDVAAQRHVDAAEAQLANRAREAAEAREAERQAARTLEALAEVALGIASSQTVGELTTVVVDQGLGALGAQGGAIAVLRGERLQLIITESLGERAQETYADLPLDGPLPPCAAARGERVFLGNTAACLDYTPEMSQVIVDTGCVSFIALPLIACGEILGSITVAWSEPQTFTPTYLGVCDALAAQCAQALARIETREAERSGAAAAVRMSEVLQRSLLTPPQQSDHLAVEVRYRPGAEQVQVGGDWYDSFLTKDGATCLVIGDVTGHDQQAAAIMGQIRNLLRGIAYTVGDPPALVFSATDRAIRDLEVGALATAILAKVEQTPAQAGEGLRLLRWTNAGHPPPLLIRPDGKVELLDREPDLLLGLDPETDRTDHEQILEVNSIVLLFTDGLIERRGHSLDEGLAWLVETVGNLGHLPLDELCDTLLDRVLGFADDDIAILALKANPDGAESPR